MAATTVAVERRKIASPSVRAASETSRRRYIDPQAGRALELLGHAIEYLIDEYVNETERISATDPQFAAIQILMALNRAIYYDCAVVPSFWEQLRAFFGLKTH